MDTRTRIITCIAFLLSRCLLPGASPQLQAEWGSTGLKTIVFEGTNFLSRSDFLVNAITFDSSVGQSTQGNTHSQITFDVARKTESLRFDWGEVDVQYRVDGDRLNVGIAVINKTASVLKSMSLDVMALQLPSTPKQYDGSTPMLGTNMGMPTLLPLDFTTGSIVVANDDVIRPLLLGLPWSLNPPTKTIFPVRINTGRDPMYPNSLPLIDRPIPPGGKDSFSISMRFSHAPSDVLSSARDVIAKFAGANEFALHWADRRPIGSLIIATAATNWKTNPRGWLLDPTIDVTTPDGVARFRSRLLAWADNSIRILKKAGAQGMITWDIEGEQFPHATTYVGDPEFCEKLAPEMTGFVDEYFGKFRAAGLRVGVTIRPQKFELKDGVARQTETPDPGAELIRKIRYAKKRWGATLFYIDSNGNPGFPLSSDVMAKVAKVFPDVLLIPEHKNVAYYSLSAPYSESRGGFYSTPALVTSVYPKAFSVINTADGGVQQHRAELTAAVNRGDILMFRSWFDDPANPIIGAICAHSTFKGQ